MTSKEQCGDDRFEIINETKQYIINATNIETSPDEMNVLDSICFRLWQLGLTKRNKDKLKELTHQPTLSECIKEWEDRGFEVVLQEKGYVINGFLADVKDKYISIRLKGKQYVWLSDETFLSYEEVHLLSKTLKALEEMKNE